MAVIASAIVPRKTTTSTTVGTATSANDTDVRPELGAEAVLVRGARQVGRDDEPEGLRAEHEHDVQPVGGEKPVRRGGAPELVREQHGGPGGGQRTRAPRRGR